MADPPAPKLRKTTIEIPIPSVRKYVGGSGPPLAKISLVPPRDTTAYIIDQFVLPTPTNTTKDSRRLVHYHIGFTDLPAAKILVPCNKVLDYVSPRELEDWEYQNFDRRVEERARELERQNADKAKAKSSATGVGKKLVGRPPKVKKDETTPSPSGSPKGDTLALAKQVAGPSLSTPQKRSLGDVVVEEDDEEEEQFRDTASNLDSDDAAIQMQLQKDKKDFELDDAVNLGLESVDQLAFPFEPSGEDSSSRASSLVPAPRDSSSREAQGPPISKPLRQVLPPLREAPPLPRAQPTRPKTTPIPPPQPWKKQGIIHPAWAQSVGLHSSPNGITGPSAKTSTPIHPMYQRDLQLSQSKISSVATTSSPVVGAASHSKDEFTEAGISTPVQTIARPGIVSNWGSINKRKTPPSYSTSSSATTTIEPPNKVPKTTASAPKKLEKEKPQKEAEPEEWEVKELLDDAWIFENGANVHKYLVLWVGDWPEGQNPTWEPEENIEDRKLIKLYEEKKKQKRMATNGSSSASKKSQKTLSRYLTMRSPYSSVAEAFEGDLSPDGTIAPIAGVQDDHEDELQKEEFFVTEEANKVPFASQLTTKKKRLVVPAHQGPRAKKTDSFEDFGSMLSRYTHNFNGGPK
ncbi:hypothetical protein QBC42DRAFT_260908 [Cladorrhinum samala]|uniref:Chromo domain-containing protein n=1 Tax=Cladorrhinum samala TaxID=585594 RepID=A0AAV9HZF6_9PEZI|nr:hypothetical protein QBC42DRAFT_260908 [Cladorrhinum samala]